MVVVEAYKVAYMELFDVLSDEQLEEVAKITEKKSYKIHDHIYERGSAAKHLCVVKKSPVPVLTVNPYGKNLGGQVLNYKLMIQDLTPYLRLDHAHQLNLEYLP